MKSTKLLLLLTLVVTITACSKTNTSLEQEQKQEAQASQQTESQQEANAAILAIRDDLKQLKREVAAIRQAVTDIHKIAMDTPEPTAKPLPAELALNLDGNDPLLGSEDAGIAIVEFSDFQCPYCKRFADQTFPAIKKNYINTGKVRYIARDFPLDFHPQAQGAAVAANCALTQGAYWQMRDSLFSNIRDLSPERYQQLASELKLDLEQFKLCSSDKSHIEEVTEDQGLAASLGISGTPSFFIGRIKGDKLVNGRLIVGAQGYQTFSTVIDSIMAAP
ncbi:DsbA family protein [Thalassomonas viridans]|uniref:DsbA family protein n=1 Tax=Thalassomonas viridans TaxID=137584 RepID=A0AAF0CAU4_9GAMM|nr:DsbA family protein [Thalassomonas viridans]WDE07243.1 DsbA family protein [Thalassomonas viridans]